MNKLVIKQEGMTALGCKIEYNGQEIQCRKLDLHMVAREVPEVVFTLDTTNIDIEIDHADLKEL